MIVERTIFHRGGEDRKVNSNPEPNDSAEPDVAEETWEWDGVEWIKVS